MGGVLLRLSFVNKRGRSGRPTNALERGGISPETKAKERS